MKSGVFHHRPLDLVMAERSLCVAFSTCLIVGGLGDWVVELVAKSLVSTFHPKNQLAK